MKNKPGISIVHGKTPANEIVHILLVQSSYWIQGVITALYFHFMFCQGEFHEHAKTHRIVNITSYFNRLWKKKNFFPEAIFDDAKFKI